MQEIKIFISSPGDVGPERGLAQAVIERLQGDYWNFVRLEAVLWETEATRAVAHFNEEIIAPADCDIVLAFLWTRLGSRMPPQFTRQDGSRFESGTEWEIVTALEGFEQNGRPDLMVYRRFELPPLSEDDPERRAEAVAQRAKLEAFWREHFQHPDGTIRRAFVAYADRDELSPRLTEHLRKLIHRRLPASVPAYDVFRPEPLPAGSPFRGLHAFGFEDAPLFFGRSRAVAGIARQFEAHAARDDGPGPFVLILGGSGSGKSSLARAGVAARLTHPNTVSGVDAWRRADCHPSAGVGRPPLEALAGALLAALPELAAQTLGGDDHALDTAAGLAAMLADPEWLPLLEPPLRAALDAAARGANGRVARAFLVVDQLEELFTDKATTDGQREAFVHALAFLAGTRAVWIAATMRSEFFARAIELPALRQLMRGEGSFTLLPPDAGEISQIVRYPAAAANLAFERHPQTAESLADAIHAEATRDARALPLLEFLLQDLYEHRDENNVLLWSRYEEVGKLAGALVSHADAALHQLRGGAEREALDLIFLSLVTMDDQEQAVPTRNRAPRAALERIQDGAGARVLEVFIAARLFVTDSEAAVPVVSLAHEALLAHWPYLQEFVQKHGTLLRARRRLADLCNRWREKADYDTKGAARLLLDEGSLAEAQEVVRFNPPDLAELEREFVHRSTQKAQTRLRRLRVAVGVFAMLAVLASVAGLYAWRQQQRARAQEKIATEQRGVAQVQKTQTDQANLRLESQLHEASMSDFLTAHDHFEKGRWKQGIAYLGRSLKYDSANRLAGYRLWSEVVHGRGDRDRLPMRIIVHAAGVNSAVYNSGGTHVLTACDDGTARIWDADDGDPVGKPMPHERAVTRARFIAEDELVLTVCADNAVRLWNATSGEPVGKPMRHESTVISADYLPITERILTFSQGAEDPNGEARLWDARTGEPVGEPMRHGGKAARNTPEPKSANPTTAELYASLARSNALPKPSPEDTISRVVYGPLSYTVLTVSKGKIARLWSGEDGKPVGEPLVHVEAITHAAVSPGGGCYVLTACGATAQWWDATTGVALDKPAPQEVFSREIVFGPVDGQALTLTEKGGETWHVTPAGGNENQQAGRDILFGRPSVPPIFSPEGVRVLTVDDTRHEVRVWPIINGDEPLGEPIHHDGDIKSAVFSPDGARVLTASSDGTACIWEAAPRKPINDVLLWGRSRFGSMSSSCDGKRLLVAIPEPCGGGGRIELRDAATGKELRFPYAYRSRFWNVVFGSDDTRALLVSKAKAEETTNADEPEGGQPGERSSRYVARIQDLTRVWEIGQPEPPPIGQPIHHDGEIRQAVFSPDGRRVVSASADGTARQWDAETGEPLGQPLPHAEAVDEACYSPNGKRIVTLAGRTMRQWDAATCEPLGEGWHHDAANLRGVRYSPDGARLLATANYKELRQWEVATGKPVGQQMPGDAEAVYSPDGRFIYQVGDRPDDKRGSVVRVRDAETGFLVGNLSCEIMGTFSAILTPDAPRILVANEKVQTLAAPPPFSAPPSWVRKFVEAASGMAFDENGKLDPLTCRERVERRAAVRAALGAGGGAEAGGAWGQLADWEFALATVRPVTPGDRCQAVTLMERYAVGDRSDSSYNPEGRALDWPPGPLANLRLAELFARLGADRSGGRTSPGGFVAHADFLRRFAADHLPDDVDTYAHAAALLVPNTPDLAVGAARKALEIEPSHVSAKRSLAEGLSNLKQPAEALAAYQELLASPGANARDFARAAALQRGQKQPSLALELARKSLTLDPDEVEARRQIAKSLQDLGQSDEAIDAYQRLLAHPAAIVEDFTGAGYLAAKQKRGDVARAAFKSAAVRFTQTIRSVSMEGWALINLDAPEESLAAFRRCEKGRTSAGKEPDDDLLAGLVIAQWLAGAKDDAVRDYQRLIATDAKYADVAKVKALGWTEAETVPLLAALDETSRRRQKVALKAARRR